MNSLIVFLILSTGIIDINRASLKELSTLPLTKEKQAAIYNYIQNRGPLHSIYDIMNIKVITPKDFAAIKPLIMVKQPRNPFRFAYYATRVRERAASEESPREAAFDEWLSFLANPINVNKADIDELYSLYGVSLQDAIQTVKYAHMTGFRRPSHLKRTPGLSYYGYRNMRPFVIYWNRRPRPVIGMVNIKQGYYSELFAEELSDIKDRISELETRDTSSNMWQNLQDAGWSAQSINDLAQRLNSERQESEKLHPEPYIKVKSHFVLWGKLKSGFLFDHSPYFLKKQRAKFYAGVENYSYIKKLILGYYHFSLDLGLLVDNTDEARDRYMDKTGMYGDVTSNREFNFFGACGWEKYRNFNLYQFFSSTRKDALLGIDGKPLFYYTSSYVPSTFQNQFKENVVGMGTKIDMPAPLPFGTQLGFGVMKVFNDALTADFSQMDIPLDRESFNDLSFHWGTGDKLFYALSGRTFKRPISLEFEYARQQKAGKAYAIKARIQQPTYYFDVLVRNYDVNYENPYARPFKEDNRFEYTPIEKSYRDIEPLASNLADLPIPKPEKGVYIATRYQPARQFLFPFAYIDVWQNKASRLWNWRFQGTVEARPVYAFRIRLKQKVQQRKTNRYLGVSVSNTKETTINSFVMLGRGTSVGVEYKYGEVELTPKTNFRESLIYGSAFLVTMRYRFNNQFTINAGVSTWTTNGMSQWNFDDTGIDFLNGNGDKFYLTLVERLTPTLGIRLKLKTKDEDTPHTGLFGHEIKTSNGLPVYRGFVSPDNIYSTQLIIDYSF